METESQLSAKDSDDRITDGESKIESLSSESSFSQECDDTKQQPEVDPDALILEHQKQLIKDYAPIPNKIIEKGSITARAISRLGSVLGNCYVPDWDEKLEVLKDVLLVPNNLEARLYLADVNKYFLQHCGRTLHEQLEIGLQKGIASQLFQIAAARKLRYWTLEEVVANLEIGLSTPSASCLWTVITSCHKELLELAVCEFERMKGVDFRQELIKTCGKALTITAYDRVMEDIFDAKRICGFADIDTALKVETPKITTRLMGIWRGTS